MWFALLVLLTLVYTAVLWARALHSYLHLYVLVLALQHLLILPGNFLFLRSKRGVTGPPALPPPRRLFVISFFAAVAVSLSWFSTRGLLNPNESGYSFLARIYLRGHLKAAPLIGATRAFSIHRESSISKAISCGRMPGSPDFRPAGPWCSPPDTPSPFLGWLRRFSALFPRSCLPST
jgi:hypothetical protein